MGFVDRIVVDEDGGGLRREFPGEDLEQGGLAGAAWADDGENLGGFCDEADILEHVAVETAVIVVDDLFCVGGDGVVDA